MDGCDHGAILINILRLILINAAILRNRGRHFRLIELARWIKPLRIRRTGLDAVLLVVLQ